MDPFPERRVSDAALARLRDADAHHLASLVGVAADALLAAPARDLVQPTHVAGAVRRALQAVVDSPTARDAIVRRVDAARAAAAAPPLGDRTARGWLIAEVEQPLRELLSTPWSPDEALVLRLINHAAVRALLAAVLSSSLHGFVDRLRHMDDGVLGGLGSKAVSRGKGWLGGIASGIGSAADGLLGQVRQELQTAMEARIHPFVDQASQEAVTSIAAWLADPAHAAALADLRLAALDVLLDTPARELAAQLDDVDTGRAVDHLLVAARGALTAPDLDGRIEALVSEVLAHAGHLTLASWLDEAGLREAFRRELTAAATPPLARVVATDAFGAWWAELHR